MDSRAQNSDWYRLFFPKCTQKGIFYNAPGESCKSQFRLLLREWNTSTENPCFQCNESFFVLICLSPAIVQCAEEYISHYSKDWRKAKRSARSFSLIFQRGISRSNESPSGCSPSTTAFLKVARSYSPSPPPCSSISPANSI
jgi:hypothetical protein